MYYEDFVSIRWTKDRNDEPFESFVDSMENEKILGVYVMSHEDRITEVKELLIKLKILT